MAALTKNDLRDYVLVGERKTGADYVLVDFTHNLTSRVFVEIGFHIDTLIDDVKFKVYSHCGTKCEFMELRFNGLIMEDDKTLGQYHVKTGDVIAIFDHDPESAALNGGLDDVSLVQKYVMSDEEYDKRPNTYRKFKAENLAKNPNWLPPWEVKERERRIAEREANPVEPIESVQARVSIGQRCEVFPGGRRGEVVYIGYIGAGPETFPDGVTIQAPVFVGVKFDEPVGKNNGSYKGKSYFTCPQGYGAFVKPSHVVVGDFPEKDPFASDEEEEVEEAEDLMEEL